MTETQYLVGKVVKWSLPVVTAPSGPDAPVLKRPMLAQGELAPVHDAEEGIRYRAGIEARAGCVRGNHYHKVKRERIYVLRGEPLVAVEDAQSKERAKSKISREQSRGGRSNPQVTGNTLTERTYKMRKNVTLAAAVALGMLLTAGCAPTPKDELSKLQGTWVGEEMGGEKGECRMTIEGNALKFKGVRPQEWYSGTLTLNPTTEPKQALILIRECGLPQYANQTAKAIYKVEGKSLTIAGNEPGKETVPTAFERNPTSQTRAFVFTKQ